ncbi:COMM domain containing 10, isoform CRA_d [Rattus norvegicus]|uniref:COMM domain containing 10 n=2 Tax=Rattus norvegicus TaxID=10116 RepID=A0ABK0LKS9_RAT|nr:COMM domain containing 10, isoform CRA_d [Rattus norvegicus]
MAASAALILPQSPSMKKAVPLINAIDTGRFPRLLSRILQKLHLKLETVGWQLNLQMAHSAQAKLQSPQAVLQLGVSKEDSKNLEKVLVEFNHKELFDFYNKLETIQAQLDSLT